MVAPKIGFPSLAFRSKKLDIGSFANTRVIRDHTKRKVYAEHEPERQALRYIIRNTELPRRMRAAAQLRLAEMHSYTRRTQIRNRCVISGKTRGILSAFHLSRFQLRLKGLAGEIPGVKKANW